MDREWLFYSPIDKSWFTYTFNANRPGDPALSGNVNVTENGYCFGQIKGDPDIAGWGVFGGFVLNAVTVAFVALWYMWIPFARLKWKQAQIQKSGSEQQNNEHHQSSPIKKADEEVDEELTPVENLVLTLGDTNLVSALAMIISSMIKLTQDPNYPLYHLFLARSLTGIALVGHNSATFVYTKLRRHRPYSLYVRWFVSFTTMILYLTWSGLALERFKEFESQTWPVFTPLCFSTHRNRVGWTFTGWIRVNMFWVPQGFAWVLLNPFKLIDSVDRTLQRLDDFLISSVKGIFTSYWRELVPSNLATPSQWMYIRDFSWRILKGTGKTVGTIFMILICSLFLSTDALQPLSNMLFGLAWGIYDVITVKISNWNAVVDALETPLSQPPTNPEQDFGIGQIFPLVMGIQLMMAFLDAISDHWNKKEQPANLGPSTPVATHQARIEPQTVNSAPTLVRRTLAQRRTLPQQLEPVHVH